MSETSPTPWKSVYGPARGVVVLDGDGEAVAAMLNPARQIADADAARIVEAVNGFNALRAFVGELCDCLEEEDAEAYKSLVAKARQAAGSGNQKP